MRKKKATGEPELTANKMTGSASGITTDRSTLPRLPPSQRELLEETIGLDFLNFFFAKLFSQHAGL